jgi:hypothetical protein
LIAHAPIAPIVIPFYHSGMEHVMPQNEVGFIRKLKYKLPRIGHDVSVRVGRELVFDDLIAAHEAEHGPLWKFTERRVDESDDEWKEYWMSSESDFILYSKITSRIEEALLELGETMKYFGKT